MPNPLRAPSPESAGTCGPAVDTGGEPAVVLARRGEGGYQQYRIPALALTNAGTLLAVYDGRPVLDDLPSPVDLVLRRSLDGGRTWEPQRILRTGAGLEGFGDASLLVDRDTGQIFCFHAASTEWGFFESEDGPERTQHVDVSISDDDGLSWRHRRLTGMLKPAGVRGIFAASGTGTQIADGPHAGRLLQPCVVLLSRGRAGRIAAAIAFSDDHGETWTLGTPLSPSSDGTDTNENSVAALSDGTVLLHSRATPHRLVARSSDGGATFCVPVPDPGLPDPSDNGSVLRLSGRGDRLAATHNAHRHLRRNTVLRYSPDGGASWTKEAVLCSGASGYSTAVELPGGRIGVLYERGAYQEMVFASVSLRDLAEPGVGDSGPAQSGSVDSGPAPLPGHPHLLTEVVPRSITPAPPARWSFADPHVVLGQADAGYGSEGKEIGQAGAQVVATRRDFRANYGEPRTGLAAGDVVTYSAAVTNAGPDTAVVRPIGTIEDPGPARVLAPGATEVWLHLNHRLARAGEPFELGWDAL